MIWLTEVAPTDPHGRGFPEHLAHGNRDATQNSCAWPSSWSPERRRDGGGPPPHEARRGREDRSCAGSAQHH